MLGSGLAALAVIPSSIGMSPSKLWDETGIVETTGFLAKADFVFDGIGLLMMKW
jgi:hypothetical protein